MAISFIDSVSASPGATGGATAAIDTTGATLLVAVIGRFSVGTMSDSQGNTWTSLDVTGLVNVTQEVYYVLNPTTNASHTFSYTGGALTFPGIAVAAFSGQTLALDQEFTNTNTGSDITLSSLTPTNADSLVVASCSHEDGNAHSIDESYVEDEDVPWVNSNNIGVYLAHKLAVGTTAQTPTITGGSSVSRVGHIMAWFEDVLVITPSGIASEEAFGSATVENVSQNLSPTGIASAEAFGSHTITVDVEEILPTGISSEEAFGSASILNGVELLPTSISSAEAFGTPSMVTGANKNYYGTVQGANTFFAARLNKFFWTNATNADKVKALKHATKLIDRFNYLDHRYTVRTWLDNNEDADLETDASQEALRAAFLEQNNEFPRGLSPIVPDEIERATYLIAKALLSGRDPDADLENLAVKQSQYGSVKTSYQRDGNNQEHLAHLIPSPQAFNLIRPFFRERDLFDVKRTS